ncbi:hypothetical protein E3N88_01966 [Mikania micrantha]|uniref:non-specific serine/threonine protein kinase n=1 Tax=Mikania micrantha TaxID=192012 RepID=A0A5N6Q566_9ASTR|nr:hypothetical protein E3N88_01966 [Mikania micrantha]
MIILLCFVSLTLFCHSALTNNISMPNCPETFNCPGLSTFEYPFFNVTDTRCGLIKVNCTAKGGELQLGGRSYEILDYYPLHKDLHITIYNRTFDHLAKHNSCEVLMNNFTSSSPSPVMYTVLFPFNITIFKCPQNHPYAYFSQHKYNSYNICKNHTFYYNILDGTVPNDLRHTCQVVQLPVKMRGPELDETNIFSLLSSNISIRFTMPSSYDDRYHCDTKNGDVDCSDIRNVPGVGCVTILIIIFLCLKSKAGRSKKAKYNVKVEMFLKNHEFIAPKRYSYSEVVKMTNSFKVKLGQGGFGVVYKGALKNENMVAVKVLSEVKSDGQDFINEVASVGRTSHVNIVSLVGFCLEGRQRALIYEFMPNGSLERFIYSHGSSSSSQLRWEKLHEIAIGIARGLEYLHRGCNTRILHFDIKPHNILLDKDFCPKISDFGLAKLFHEKESKISMSHMRGTPGYIAPELFSRNFGEVSHKSDVYSYGMMILEMVGGRKNIEVEVDHTSEIYFPHWIYKKVELHEEELGLHGIVSDEQNRIVRKMIIAKTTQEPSRSQRVKVMLDYDILRRVHGEKWESHKVSKFEIFAFEKVLHFAAYTSISRANCPESFYCPGLTPFKYPLFNVTDTRCGLIKINCTSKGGEIQLGGQSYEITGKCQVTSHVHVK